MAAATELRMRAFTVLIRTYEEARSAIGYLRRKEEDVDTIAPNLYPGRPSRRNKPASSDATQVPPGTVTPPVNAPGTTSPVVAAPVVPAGSTSVPVSAQDGSIAHKGPFA